MKTGTYRYIALENVHFGIPAAAALAEEAKKRAASRIFVVSSKTLNRTTDVVRTATSGIRHLVVGDFDQCEEHSPRETVIALSKRFRESGADLVVSIGGGTVIDTVKVALLCVAEGIMSVEELDRCRVSVDSDGRRVVPVLTASRLRQVAVPTTLSAAEFSDLAGCTDRRVGQKHLYIAPCIGPVSVILDPQATLPTPERLWLSTGIRAIDHAVEGVCSIDAMPLVDATSLPALTLLSKGLRKYRQTPQDLQVRLNSQTGAWLASTGVNRVNFGASHGVGHVIGGAYGVPHGITSCVLLPSVLRFNRSAIGDRGRLLAEALGDRDAEPADLVARLIEDLGLPTRLRDVGIHTGDFPELARKAMDNPWVRANPEPINHPEQVEEILRQAW